MTSFQRVYLRQIWETTWTSVFENLEDCGFSFGFNHYPLSHSIFLDNTIYLSTLHME